MSRLRFQKAIAGNIDYLTAQAFIFPKEGFITSQGTQPFISVLITGSGEDAFAKVRQSAISIEEIILEDTPDLPELGQKILDNLKVKLADVQNLQILVAIYKSEILYIKRSGTAKAYLLRDGNIADLTIQVAGEEVVSGFLKEGDKVLLLSDRLKDDTDEAPKSWDDLLHHKLINTQIENFEEEIELTAQTLNSLEPLASVLIENHPDIKEIKPSNEPNALSQSPKISLPSINFIRFRTKLSQINPKIFFGLLILIIISGVGFLAYNKFKPQSPTEASINSAIEESRSKLNEALSLKDSDSEKAATALIEAKSSLSEAQKIDADSDDVKSLEKDINDNSKAILKVVDINDWETYLSLNLIKDNFDTDKISYSLGQILMLDTKNKTLVSLNLNNKTNQILAGETQLGDAKFASLNGDQAFVFSSDKGVLNIDTQSKKISTVSKSDSEWGNISDLVGFSSNVYLLDSGKNTIWKYSPIATGFTDKISYLKEGQSPNFNGSLRMHIDFSVWVVKPDEILKFTAGNSDFFAAGGLEKNISSIRDIFVSEEEDKLCLLDPDNSRIIILKKNGQYLSQINSEKLKTSEDFIIDEENKKIYLLEDGKIHRADLPE